MTDPETGIPSIPKDIATGDAYVTHGQVSSSPDRWLSGWALPLRGRRRRVLPLTSTRSCARQAPWISEMWGYAFAAAEAGFRHILTEGIVVYPAHVGAGRADEANIIHYGLHCTVDHFHFTK